MTETRPLRTLQAVTFANLYIWHDTETYHGHGAVSRFFFTERLTAPVFEQLVKPKLLRIPGVMPGMGVRFHERHITVQWSTMLHDNDYTALKCRIERTATETLGHAFDWTLPTVRYLSSLREVYDVALARRVDWRLGRL